MPVHDPHDKESWPRSDIVPSDTKDVQGARYRGFISEKIRDKIISFLLAIFIALFCTLIAWLFII